MGRTRAVQKSLSSRDEIKFKLKFPEIFQEMSSNLVPSKRGGHI